MKFKRGDRVEWHASEHTVERGVVVGLGSGLVVVLWESGERGGAPTTGPRRVRLVRDTPLPVDDQTIPDHSSATLKPWRTK